jgi:hypothetical protein
MHSLRNMHKTMRNGNAPPPPPQYLFLVSGSVCDWSAMLQAGRSRVRDPMRPLNLFNLPNSSTCTMALGFTQLVTEMSTRKPFLGKARPACKNCNLTAICEPIVYWQCEILDISHPCWPARPITGIALRTCTCYCNCSWNRRHKKWVKIIFLHHEIAFVRYYRSVAQPHFPDTKINTIAPEKLYIYSIDHECLYIAQIVNVDNSTLQWSNVVT